MKIAYTAYMKKEYILFIDSGVGGLSTLAETIKILPTDFIYFADNLHMPYGRATDDEIFENLKNIVSFVTEKYSVSVVVLACNTATTCAIKKLRETFKNLVFVGTEPAIKVASDCGYKRALVLVTPTTGKALRFAELKNSASCEIKPLMITGLANNIDGFLLGQNLAKNKDLMLDISKILSCCKNIDAVVLGCTHYVFLKPIIQEKTGLPVFDGNFGVAKKIASISRKKDSFTVKFMFSFYEKNLAQKYRKILSQTLANRKNLC